MIYCADTSFLISLYGTDANTAAAIGLVQTSGIQLHTHTVSVFEFENALRLREFRGKMTAQERHALTTLYQADVRAGRIKEHDLDLTAVFRISRELSRKHTVSLGNRAYDVLQVAAAITVEAGAFLSFDTRQRHLAAAEGITVLP